MKTRHLIIGAVLIALAAIEYAVVANLNVTRMLAGDAAVRQQAQAATSAGPSVLPVYDPTHLLRPEGGKYLGVAIDGAPPKMKLIETFAKKTGKKPNVVTLYLSFDDGFAADEVRQIYEYGALPAVRWEPFDAKLSDIAAGRHDDYIKEFAAGVRKVNLPIMLTFAHEMNGNWYSWGMRRAGNKAAHFVAAWKHIHGLFAEADATNVIWAWTPNVINPMPEVKLKPLYPGDRYVDWIGIDGYYTHHGANTYAALFGPTMKQVRGFTDKPFLIVETAAEPGNLRPSWLADLFTGVARDPEVIGFVFFNNDGSAKWNIDRDEAAIRAFRQQAKNATYGFPVR
ncbi:glycoside hydrolase family 26 protein [Micromonospora sp. NBC_01739]|uniref:glycoside hydrolase family 26 protein n=1 Tax=Micromonospora sp. NBC_01739 TaxID=2975985 RepID=UPI002E148272|nr:glycosyl hydrolase [Micromonospora sp. NBC_01739]